MSKHSNIVLVGPMGAGKSTVGRLLASRLGFSFVDTDSVIEDRTGADIPWIFDVEVVKTSESTQEIFVKAFYNDLSKTAYVAGTQSDDINIKF